MTHIPHANRRAIVMQAEGAALHGVGAYGADQQAELIRLQIDGLFNALVRIEGPEAAAKYAFAMSDRVAGGLREPTDFRLPKPVLLQPAPPTPYDPQDVAPPKPDPKWWHPTAWRWGFLHGVLVGALVAIWAIGANR